MKLCTGCVRVDKFRFPHAHATTPTSKPMSRTSWLLCLYKTNGLLTCMRLSKNVLLNLYQVSVLFTSYLTRIRKFFFNICIFSMKQVRDILGRVLDTP